MIREIINYFKQFYKWESIYKWENIYDCVSSTINILSQHEMKQRDCLNYVEFYKSFIEKLEKIGIEEQERLSDKYHLCDLRKHIPQCCTPGFIMEVLEGIRDYCEERL